MTLTVTRLYPLMAPVDVIVPDWNRPADQRLARTLRNAS